MLARFPYLDKNMGMLRGIAVSSGIARGTAIVLACADRAAGTLRRVEASQVEAEIARFEAALDKTERDLLALQRSVQERIGSRESDIFTAQALVVRDPVLTEKVRAAVLEPSERGGGSLPGGRALYQCIRQCRGPLPPRARSRGDLDADQSRVVQDVLGVAHVDSIDELAVASDYADTFSLELWEIVDSPASSNSWSITGRFSQGKESSPSKQTMIRFSPDGTMLGPRSRPYDGRLRAEITSG